MQRGWMKLQSYFSCIMEAFSVIQNKKVIAVGTIGEPLCDFLSVININRHAARTLSGYYTLKIFT